MSMVFKVIERETGHDETDSERRDGLVPMQVVRYIPLISICRREEEQGRDVQERAVTMKTGPKMH